MNGIWVGMLLFGAIFAFANGSGGALPDALLSGAAQAVQLCLSLLGAYALWMGILSVAQRAGLVEWVSRLMRPLLRRLFPGVPPRGAAAQAICMNLSANALGMGNAATPFGLLAMSELQKFNREGKQASHAMCMLLIVNAGAFQVLPTTVLAMRASAGSGNPAAILLPTWIATGASTLAGVLLARLCGRAAWRRG